MTSVRLFSWPASLGNFGQSDALGQFLVANVHVEDLLSALDVRQPHGHAAVEAAGSQQGIVQDIGSVGGGYHDHTAVAFKTIHLGQDPKAVSMTLTWSLGDPLLKSLSSSVSVVLLSFTIKKVLEHSQIF